MKSWTPVWLLVVAITLSGCDSDRAVIWEAHVRSPDGHYRANATTTQQSGPGNAALYSEVNLSQGDADEGCEILSFSHHGVYELKDGAVTMTWVGNTTLHVEYVPSATVDFQAIKCAGVTIELEPRSK